MLHVTNGDSAVEVLRRSGLAGELLAWRDVLHEGPVPAGLPPADLRACRARFLAGSTGASKVVEDLIRRDRQLDEAAARGEIVLWFEHDLYDQLQLLQLLDHLAATPARVTLVCGTEYLGNSAPERLVQRFPERRTVGAAEFQYARAAWAAFRSPDPRDIAAVLRFESPPLPYVAPALRRHLQQYPALRTGLSRSEAQTLAALADGVTRMDALFVEATQKREEALFLGDSVFAGYLAGLSDVEAPLLLLVDGGRMVTGMDQEPGFWQREARLTGVGAEILAGKADHVRLNGIDRWLGGVHLAGREAAWRWDPERGSVVRGSEK